jgi:transposase InsO family protein
MKELSVADRRLSFVRSVIDGDLNISQACRVFGISRPTGYAILQRFENEGVAGLSDRSRAPLHRPQTVDEAIANQILALKVKHPSWGPKKLKASLEESTGNKWPATSTFGDILKRAGLVKSRHLKSRCPSAPIRPTEQRPNELWCVDYKGQFSLRGGHLCYPLTMTDQASRYLLRCQALPDVTGTKAWPYFVGAFQEYGLPAAIRSDNGAPFAAASTTGLTYLSLRLIKLGIRLERIDPGKPQQNGAHERMHRTLKAEAISPASDTLIGQQGRFDAWRREFNDERPHEALDQRTPGSIYVVSPRAMPLVLPELEYPAGMRVTRVRTNGMIRWRGGFVFVSEVLIGELVGLDPFDEHYYALYVGRQPVAILDERTAAFLPAKQASKMLSELSRHPIW